MKKIIDVSKWNGITNFSTIHEKVDGVIVRIGYRGNNSPILVSDPRYFPYMTELNKYGNPLGAYFMTSAITLEEAREEADFFTECIEHSGIKLSLPLFVRSEWNTSAHNGRSDNISNELRTDIIIAFINECKAKGYECGISATAEWFNTKLCLENLKEYAKWIIDKTDKATLSSFGNSLMIYTENDKFEVKGIAGNVVLSKINTSLLSPYIKKNTEKKDESKEETKPIKKEPKKKEYKLGGRIKLNKADLYSTSISSTVIDVVTGNFYIANEKILRGRIRISDKKDGEVIGWVDTN